MVVLGYHADEDCLAAPSNATIQAYTAFCERAVRGALRALEAERLIVRRARIGEHGETLPTVYYLAFMEPRPTVQFPAHWEHRV
jgi:hypothetical protein